MLDRRDRRLFVTILVTVDDGWALIIDY